MSYYDDRVTEKAYYKMEVPRAMIKRVAEGETLVSICEGPGMPSRKTFYAWLVSDPQLSADYATAVRTAVMARK